MSCGVYTLCVKRSRGRVPRHFRFHSSNQHFHACDHFILPLVCRGTESWWLDIVHGIVILMPVPSSFGLALTRTTETYACGHLSLPPALPGTVLVAA